MSKLLSQLDKLEQDAKKKIEAVTNLKELEQIRIEFTGRKSALIEILRGLKNIKGEERPLVGKRSNEVKTSIEKYLETKKSDLETVELEKNIASEWLDVTLPVPELKTGHKHPISSLMEFTEDIFLRMGFEVMYPNELDSEFNNFTAVNIPDEHPAKDMWDTFWTEDGHVAITHTSSMQNRVLSSKEPPIRVIVPGKVFRNEATDARHEHTFYQVEGVYVDKRITMAHMLGTLKAFFAEFFEQDDVNILFTPDFFPFVEPGGMISIDCSNLGEGFKKVSKGSGWLEVLGCGMIHPKVLEIAGIDPEVYSGFAWGFGLERMIMLKYGIDDVRLFHSGDLRFIRQF